MTVGLPGVGLGGIFYLVSAALMPVRELVRALRRETPVRWSIVRRQTAIAGGIVAALWITGWLLGVLIASSSAALALSGRGPVAAPAAHNLLRASALALSLGTLTLVLTSVQLARLFVTRRESSRIAAAQAASLRLNADGRDPVGSSPNGRVDSGTFGRAR